MALKNILRAHILPLRNQLDVCAKENAEQLICEKLIHSELFKKAVTVMSYMDFRNEVPVNLLNKSCLSEGKNLLLPYCVDQERMVAVSAEALPDGNDKDRYGIRVPGQAMGRIVRPETIDLIIVPSVVYNRQCYRIGYGKGFYDRFLSSVRPDCIKIGVAYELQIVNDHFQEDYDIPTDVLISEKKVYYHEHCKVRL
ncbi:MAG TPA: 5-formyltetrahydrofolate cyclo-ligase [Clostridiales bacterium]|nr:5-formyltetrahydrofolate cyclo-ligase [Clostridiales bacterium]